MSTQPVTLFVQPKGKPFKNIPSEIALPKGAPASEIYQQLARRIGTSVHQVRVTKGSDGTLVPNEKEVPVLQTGLLDGSKIYVKDLGKLRHCASFDYRILTSSFFRKTNRLADCLCHRILWSAAYTPPNFPVPPVPILEPYLELLFPSPQLRPIALPPPSYAALPQARVRNPIRPSLLERNYAIHQHLQELRTLLDTGRGFHRILYLLSLCTFGRRCESPSSRPWCRAICLWRADQPLHAFGAQVAAEAWNKGKADTPRTRL